LFVMANASKPPSIQWFRTVIIGIALLLCTLLVGCERQSPSPRSSDVTELSRVTSPNGQLDAVLTQDAYGGAIGGGVESNVYIVRKGTPIKTDTAHTILQADPFTHGKLVWKQEHLLEIYYDVAHIEQFRNLWGLHEVEDVGSRGEHNFEVEIRLEPLADDFSMLTPSGSFREPY
jgi:hypothetical protein